MQYDSLYANATPDYFSWVRNVAEWKAAILCRLIRDEPTQSILEIGTGRGDVLNACRAFRVRWGADVSEEALSQHRELYGTERLEKLDANNSLPFKNREVDFVLLCDILEHVEYPAELLREAGRVGQNVLVKIPLENAFLIRLMTRLRGINYGPTHPSGHLHFWSLREVHALIITAGLEVVRGEFVKTPFELLRRKTWLKRHLFRSLSIVDYFVGSARATRALIGGSYFAVVRKRP